MERYVAALSRLCEGEPDEGRATGLYLALGRVLEHDVRDDARAAAAYRRAEALAAQSGAAEHEIAAIWHSLADVYGRLGDFAAQEALLERRLGAVGPGTEPAELADATYQLAAHAPAPAGGDRRGAGAPRPRVCESIPSPTAPKRSSATRWPAAAARGSPVGVPGHAGSPVGVPGHAGSPVGVPGHAGSPAGVPEHAAVARALEHLARVTGRDSALVDALLVISEIDPEGDAAARLEPLVEAVAIAERLGDAPRAEALLRSAVARAATLGDAPLAWALPALPAHRAAAGDLAEAAALRERAARAGRSRPRARAAPRGGRAGRGAPRRSSPARRACTRSCAPASPASARFWQPLAEVYRRLGDRARLAALLEETAPLLEGAAERGRLRLERARMAIDEDQDKAVALLKDVIEDDPSAVGGGRGPVRAAGEARAP